MGVAHVIVGVNFWVTKMSTLIGWMDIFDFWVGNSFCPNKRFLDILDFLSPQGSVRD